MYEVEVKVRAAHARVRERLADADAERLGAVEQSDTYYAAPHREFAETDEALRVRSETTVEGDPADDETRLTYKGPLVDSESKTREEHETAVDDESAARGILDGLGFDPAATVEKERERYAVGEYTVTLDSVADLGEFVEVERTVPEADVESAREGARALVRDLGLDPDEGIRTSYLGLLLDGREEGDDPDASE